MNTIVAKYWRSQSAGEMPPSPDGPSALGLAGLMRLTGTMCASSASQTFWARFAVVGCLSFKLDLNDWEVSGVKFIHAIPPELFAKLLF